MAFKEQPAAEVTADTPEKLFALLPRTGTNSGSLWSQQTDLLREYVKTKQTARDLAIELPTGTGKTLTGLLIGDWRRRKDKCRVLFACPTVQLVRQVITAARREGIPVVDLSGPFQSWPPADKLAYEQGRAMAIVTYSAVFNFSPKLLKADVQIFDDAHAGEQYVSSAYTVDVSRRTHNAVYTNLLESIKTGLTSERATQLTMNQPGAGTRRLVDALFLALREDWLGPITLSLDAFSTADKSDRVAKSQTYRLAAIREHLSACVAFVSWDRIQIRPMIAPTFTNALFSAAKQRIFLSATLGNGGEIERAFGRPNVKRLTLPTQASTPKSGRRFLVFPNLVSDADPQLLTKEILELSEKAIVITPSERVLEEAKETLVPESWSVFTKSDIEDSFDAFARSTHSVALLANRYDGIDLPGDSCRAVTLHGFPSATNLMEEFLSTRARAGSVMEERVRSRIVQGTGRCTRGPHDWALVIIGDTETTSYLSRSEVQESLDEELHSEVEFGLVQSDQSREDILDNVRHFLAQDADWRVGAEPKITEILSTVQSTDFAAATSMSDAAAKEVQALELLWNSDWRGAATNAASAAAALASNSEARGYRATLFFMSAVYFEKASREADGDEVTAKLADATVAQAVATASPSTWMNAFLPFEGRGEYQYSDADLDLASRVAPLISENRVAAKLSSRFEAMLEGLQAVDHNAFEPALTELGLLLGTQSFKPSGEGRADSVWCWGDRLWLTLEAKSEHTEGHKIGLDDVRQINHQLEYVAVDRQVAIPSESASLLISPRTLFKQDAIDIANENTYKLVAEDLAFLAQATQRLWLVLQTLSNIKLESDRIPGILNAFREAALLPADVLERLTQRPIKFG